MKEKQNSKSRAIKKDPDTSTDCCWEGRVYNIPELQPGNMHQIFTASKCSFLDPLFQGPHPEAMKDVPKERLYMDIHLQCYFP